ncbi:protein kinase family protein [Mycolicibacterium sp. S2-37]|uniref:protein kinase family protein n=1 Tax=Mycolicibacterium sp. S2-37 TaxID=2810297 RepID=UPI001A93AE81|nr:protein kinase family protein [Mycolicibacterium sp. S2-37]MBO0680018.1 protein kinase family protein [Mycolicibacterium sp. S2-37]
MTDGSAENSTDPPTQPFAVLNRPPPSISGAAQRPGGVVARRYRLLTCHGRRRVLEFWQAVDIATGRLVALTLVDPHHTLPVEFVNEILSLTVRLRGIDTVGVAPILEVLHTGRFGVVISDWIPGGSVREVAETNPSALGAATALESLADAAEAAHRAGVRLNIDDPARVRLSADGRAVLAFPATLPDATAPGDLRGIGGCLYALLVGRWVDDSSPDWIALEHDPAGEPVTLAELRDDVPYLISATAAGLVRSEPGIATASTLVTMLRQAAADAAAETSDIRVLAPLPPPPPGAYAGFRNFGPAEQGQAARKSVLRASIGAAAAIVVVGVVLLGSGLNDFFTAPDETAALDAGQLGLGAEPPATPPPPRETVKAGAADAPVKPVKAEAFSPDGRPDNPEDAARVIDGDPASAWSTDNYFDAEPFPAFKEGLGLMLQLPAPTTLGSVTVDLGSTGTVLQVRTAPGSAPGKLADTEEISAPTPVNPGRNTIALTSNKPVSNVLVWVSKLGNTNGKNQIGISEITLHPPGPPA